VTISVEITAVAPYIAPIRPTIAPVAAEIAPVLPDVARFLPRCGCITLSDLFPALALVLPNVTSVLASITPVVTQVASVAAHFMLVCRAVAGLLGIHGGRDAERQSQQRGDKCAVLHSLVLERVVSPG